jgi:hypothetical protein
MFTVVMAERGRNTRGYGVMPGWFAGVAGTFVLSMVSAYAFLRLRCRGAGYPFSRRAKWWAVSVILLTAILATGVSLAVVAVTDQVRAAFLSLVIPSGLWIGQGSTQDGRRRSTAWLRPLVACLTFPLAQLDDRMGGDLQDWCDARLEAASGTPQRVADAARYYHNQVATRLRNSQGREQLHRWRESIEHKASIVRLISLDTTPARLHAALQWHPSTRDSGRHAADNLSCLADRLESEAQNELYLFLAQVYRLGFRKLLIYPLRPPAPVRARRPPLADRNATAE